MTSVSGNRKWGSRRTKVGKNWAVFLAEKLQAAQAQRRTAHGLRRQKEESSQRKVWRRLRFLVRSSQGPEAHQLLGTWASPSATATGDGA